MSRVGLREPRESAACLLFGFLEEAIQNAIHELPGLPSAKSPSQIDGFIDRRPSGNVGKQDFVGAQPQHVAVRDGHPPQAPVLRTVGQQLVDFLAMAADTGQQRGGEFHQHRILIQPLLEKPVRGRQAVTRVQIIFEEDLQNNLSSSTASRHVGLRGQ